MIQQFQSVDFSLIPMLANNAITKTEESNELFVFNEHREIYIGLSG
ncbi:hypothetical protein L4D09_14405 [Photobacterium makurazakiensis]